MIVGLVISSGFVAGVTVSVGFSSTVFRLERRASALSRHCARRRRTMSGQASAQRSEQTADRRETIGSMLLLAQCIPDPFHRTSTTSTAGTVVPAKLPLSTAPLPIG